MRILLKSLREYKKYVILTPILLTFEVAMEMSIPYLMADIINKGILNNDMGYIYRVALYIVIAALLSLLCGIGNSITASIASSGFASNLRQDLFAKIQSFSFSNINKFSSSSLITRLTTDVQNVQMSFQMIIRLCYRAPCIFIIAFVMIFNINAILASIFLALIPVLGLTIYILIKKAYPVFIKMFNNYDILNNKIEENLLAIRTVKAYAREEAEIEKVKEATANIKVSQYSSNMITLLTNPLMMFFTYLAILIISYVGAHLIVADKMMVGAMMTIFIYAMMIIGSLMIVSMLMVMLSMSKAAAQRLADVLNTQVDMEEQEEGLTKLENSSVEFKNVSFSYNNKFDILKHLNFKIQDGEYIGIIGPTGSGKSTLVSLLARLYDTSSGQVLVGGQDVKEYELKTLRTNVALVLQKNQLFSGTIRSNMAWGDEDVTDGEILEALKKSGADFVKGLDQKVSQEGANFSGGQIQRLCIARALLRSPKIIVFDDSTSAVDAETNVLIKDSLDEIKGLTKIIISQRIQSIISADRIMVLSDGEISGFDTAENLTKNNKLFNQIMEIQMKGALNG